LNKDEISLPSGVGLSFGDYEAAVSKAQEFRGADPLGIVTPRFYHLHIIRGGLFQSEIKEPDPSVRQKCLESGFIGADPFTVELMAEIEQCADLDSPVLITGETGTGKEVAARTIHKLGSRREREFLPVNCGGVPEALIEAELFGYVRGAFTGAASETKGLVEKADGGTLFLDEIGEMPVGLQVKLLRVLNDGSYFRLGDRKQRHADVRIIGATNRDIDEAVSDGSFRLDLLHRINATRIHIWPLYLRPGDIPLLVYWAIEAYNEEHRGDHSVSSVGNWLIQQALYNRWFGNVRELQTRVVQACYTARRRKDDPSLVKAIDIQDQLPDAELLAHPQTHKGRNSYFGKLIQGRVRLSKLCSLDCRKLLKRFDSFRSVERKREWEFAHRLMLMSDEERGLKPFQTFYDREVWQKGEKEPPQTVGAEAQSGARADGDVQAFPDHLLALSLEELRARYISQLLERHDGNVSAVAKQAGMSPKTIRKCRKGNMD
jgi:DNA-binding NtrC family response regulator